ncbi:uncharacterized protein [Elaeis guineensis]|uniref:uncharacterized protein isoform X2 n=1 Tax=Elaeis guineensis var. tenera TaxID=51953 RepID=UPI003C6D3F0D
MITPPSSQLPPTHIPSASLDPVLSEVTPSTPSLADVAPPLSRYQQLLQSHGIMGPPPSSQLPSAHVPLASLDPTPPEVAPPAPPPSSQLPQVHTSHTELEPIDHTHPVMDVTPDVSSIGSTSMDGCKKRGCTRGIGLSKTNKALGKKIEINISTKEGRPTNAIQSVKLSNKLGIIARNIFSVKPRWSKLTEVEMQIAFDKLDQKLDVKGLKTDEEVCASIKKLLLLKSKDPRYRLHMHYLNHRKDSKPSTMSTVEWIDLCTYWSKEKTQLTCEHNKKSRSFVKCQANIGSKAFVPIRHKINENELNGEEYDRIMLWYHTHYTPSHGDTPSRWTTPECENEIMQVLEQFISDGHPMTPDQICDKVLETRSDYIYGLGVEPHSEG